MSNAALAPAGRSRASRELTGLLDRLSAAGPPVDRLPAQGRKLTAAQQRCLVEALPHLTEVELRLAAVRSLQPPQSRAASVVPGLLVELRRTRSPRLAQAILAALEGAAGGRDVEALDSFVKGDAPLDRRRPLLSILVRIPTTAASRALREALDDPALTLAALDVYAQHYRRGSLRALRALTAAADSAVRDKAAAVVSAYESRTALTAPQLGAQAGDTEAPTAPAAAEAVAPEPPGIEQAPTEQAHPQAELDTYLGYWEGIRRYVTSSFRTRSRGLASVATLVVAVALLPVWGGAPPSYPLLGGAGLLYAASAALHLHARRGAAGDDRIHGTSSTDRS